MASFLSTLFGGGAEAEAADKNRALTNAYGVESQGYLKDAYDTGRGDLSKAVGAYDPLKTMGANYGKAGDLWLDSLGVNGPAGNTRGINAFQTTPGFDLTQKAAEEALARKHAIAGDYASGTADIDTTNWITKNLYEQQYAPWMTGLKDAAGMGGQYTAAAAGGEAAAYGGLANLASQYGSNQVGVAGNVLGGNTSANTLQASGEASGAKNLLGAGLSLASLAMGVPMGGGGGGGGGGGFSNSLAGTALAGLKNMNIGQPLFGGGSPTGYG